MSSIHSSMVWLSRILLALIKLTKKMKLLLQYPIRVFFSLIIFCRHSIITYFFFYIKPDTNSNSIATPTCTSHGCRCPCPVYTVSHGFVRTSGVSGCAWVQSSATIGYSVIELVSICYINRNWTIYQNSKRKKKIKGHGIKLFKWAKQFPIFFLFNDLWSSAMSNNSE